MFLGFFSENVIIVSFVDNIFQLVKKIKVTSDLRKGVSCLLMIENLRGGDFLVATGFDKRLRILNASSYEGLGIKKVSDEPILDCVRVTVGEVEYLVLSSGEKKIWVLQI